MTPEVDRDDPPQATVVPRPRRGAVVEPRADRAVEPVPGRRWRRLLARPWWIPAGLTLGIGSWRLGTPDAWSDEMATWGIARAPWSEVFALFRDRDAFIAPYYLLIRLWAEVFGTSDVALRLPSLLAMAVAAGLLAHLGTRLVSARVGLLAGVLFALTPAISRYAQEQRMYALVVLAAILATLLLDRALDRPSWRRFAVYAAAVTGLGWLHVLALALLPAHGCAVVVWARSRRATGSPGGLLVRWLAASAAAVLLVSPLLAAAYLQRGYAKWIPPVDWTAVPTLFNVAGSLAVGGLAVGLALAARVGRRPGALLISWAVLPIALLFGVSLATPMYLNRYVLYVLPAWLLLAAAGVAGSVGAAGRAGSVGAAGRPGWRIGVAIVIFAVAGLPAQLDVRRADGHGKASRAAAAIIAGEFRPGDAIVYALPEIEGSWFARDVLARYVPADRRPRDALAVRPQRHGGRVLAEECVDLVPCLADAPRVWVLRNGVTPHSLAGMSGAKWQVLHDRYEQQSVRHLPGMTVAVWVRRPA